MDSCIYEGRVRHTRRTPAEHSFNYRLFLMYLDLDELPRLFDKRWFWSTSRPAKSWGTCRREPAPTESRTRL